MSYLLIILYAISLVYFAVAERMSKFVLILSMQGFILFGVAFYSLIEIQLFDFIFILAETVLVKALIIPWFMKIVPYSQRSLLN